LRWRIDSCQLTPLCSRNLSNIAHSGQCIEIGGVANRIAIASANAGRSVQKKQKARARGHHAPPRDRCAQFRLSNSGPLASERCRLMAHNRHRFISSACPLMDSVPTWSRSTRPLPKTLRHPVTPVRGGAAQSPPQHVSPRFCCEGVATGGEQSKVLHKKLNKLVNRQNLTRCIQPLNQRVRWRTQGLMRSR
jgi:hypothetical protein